MLPCSTFTIEDLVLTQWLDIIVGDCRLCQQGMLKLWVVPGGVIAVCDECYAIYVSPQAIKDGGAVHEEPQFDIDQGRAAKSKDLEGTIWKLPKNSTD